MVKKKKQAAKRKRKAPVRRIAATKKRKTTGARRAQVTAVVEQDNPLLDAAFVGKLAQVVKYIDLNSRPVKQSAEQRNLLRDVAKLYLEYGIDIRGSVLTEQDKSVLTAYVNKE